MEERFFDSPILNSPYEYPMRHWELDAQGQPTQQIVDYRRKAEFITPIPKPRKRRAHQRGFVFDEGKGLSTEDQQYEATTAVVNGIRQQVERLAGHSEFERLGRHARDRSAAETLAAPQLQQPPSLLLPD